MAAAGCRRRRGGLVWPGSGPEAFLKGVRSEVTAAGPDDGPDLTWANPEHLAGLRLCLGSGRGQRLGRRKDRQWPAAQTRIQGAGYARCTRKRDLRVGERGKQVAKHAPAESVLIFADSESLDTVARLAIGYDELAHRLPTPMDESDPYPSDATNQNRRRLTADRRVSTIDALPRPGRVHTSAITHAEPFGPDRFGSLGSAEGAVEQRRPRRWESVGGGIWGVRSRLGLSRHRGFPARIGASRLKPQIVQ